MSANPHGGPPVTFVHQGSRGPGVNVPTNPVVGTAQAGPGPSPKPTEKIEHTPLGMKPRIDYQPGAVDGTPAVSIGDIHDFHASPATDIDPGSTADIGALGTDDTAGTVTDIADGGVTIIPSLTDPAYDLEPPSGAIPMVATPTT